MTDKHRITFFLDDEAFDALQRYRFENWYGSQSRAIQELLEEILRQKDYLKKEKSTRR